MVKKFFTLNCFFAVMILISTFFTACSLEYLPHGELIDTTASPNNEYVETLTFVRGMQRQTFQ